MAYYDDTIIEEVRARNNIVDVIAGYVPLKKKGSRYFGLCPFHQEKTASFSVSADEQLYYCFGCGAGGTVFTFLMQYENLDFSEAVEELAARAGMQITQSSARGQQRREKEKRESLLDIQKEAAMYYYRLLYSRRGQRALAYFHERQLTDDTIRHFGLGYSDKYRDDLYRYLKEKGYSDERLKESGLVTFHENGTGTDKFWNRAMFPIMDVRSRVIGFGGRVMGDGEPKYLNSPETMIFDKSSSLYGLNYARKSKRSGILLCEGYMDVIALHQAGFDNAVASLGTSFTMGHAGLLRRYAKEVYLTFDSDDAGIRAALRAIPILKEAGLKAKVVSMTPHKDPDEFIKALGADAYEERIRQAENSFFFELRMLERDYDLQDPEGRMDFFRAAAERILQFEDELEREEYMQKTAERYMIRAEQFRALVSRQAAAVGYAKRQTPRPASKARKSEAEDGYHIAQRMLLYYLYRYPQYYETIRCYIRADDFTDALYREVAQMLFAQLEQGAIDLVQITNRYQDGASLKEIARIFSVSESFGENGREREQAIRDAMYRVKQSSLAQDKASDTGTFEDILQDKKQLEAIRGLRFTQKE